jgi:hypothetical protein
VRPIRPMWGKSTFSMGCGCRRCASNIVLGRADGPKAGHWADLSRLGPAFLRFGGLAFVRFVAKSFKPRAS